jgi:CheY-like chemotaxis protein
VWVEVILTKLHRWIAPDTPLYRAAGCSECANTGYRGRFSIVEVLRATPEVERRIAAGETAERIHQAAVAGGMKSLWDSGLAHVLRGETSIDELLRVVDVPQEDGFQEEVAAPKKPRTSGPGFRERSPEGGVDATTAFDLIEPLAAMPMPATRTTGSVGKVLLVDDEDQLRRVMRDLLEREGYTVTEARDGIEALDQVDRVGPDIIVLDLNLPGLDGYGVLSHLRSRPATAKIPVIVLTAKGDEDNEVRVLELGADDFITKPFRPRALGARLNTLLARRR